MNLSLARWALSLGATRRSLHGKTLYLGVQAAPASGEAACLGDRETHLGSTAAQVSGAAACLCGRETHLGVQAAPASGEAACLGDRETHLGGLGAYPLDSAIRLLAPEVHRCDREMPSVEAEGHLGGMNQGCLLLLANEESRAIFVDDSNGEEATGGHMRLREGRRLFEREDGANLVGLLCNTGNPLLQAAAYCAA
jgi:hypothetical protein